MKVVLDTNIILAAFSTRSPYKVIIDELFDQRFELYIVNDILLEYEEKLKEKFNQAAAESFISALNMLTNVHQKETYYQFHLIRNDEDDNKFADCAIAVNADYLVTNDKHFNVLKRVDFPKVNVISMEDFIKVLEGKN